MKSHEHEHLNAYICTLKCSENFTNLVQNIYPLSVRGLVMMVPAGIIATKTILTPKGLETDKKP